MSEKQFQALLKQQLEMNKLRLVVTTGALRRLQIVSPFFTQINIFSLDIQVSRVIISRRNLARVLSIHHIFLTSHFPSKYRYHGNE